MGQKKNRDAEIEQLYREMFDSLIAYAVCSLRNYALAEEAVQETFRIACAKQEELFASPNRKGWLINTLKHVLRNTKRIHARMYGLLITTMQEQDNQDIHMDELDVDVLFADLLNDPDYQLMKKVVLEQRSALEIADELGISLSACRKRVQRARLALQEKLSENKK